MRKWVGLLLAVSLASCGGESTTKSPNTLATNDFESLDGWLGDNAPSLTKEKAHSGAYSVSVRPGLDYSLGYSNILGKMTPSRPQKIKLNAWVFLPSTQAGAQIVTEMHDPSRATDNTLLYQAIDLKKEVKKFNEWQQIEKVLTVPPTANAASSFKMYLWRADSGQPVYMDDVTLSLADDAK